MPLRFVYSLLAASPTSAATLQRTPPCTMTWRGHACSFFVLHRPPEGFLCAPRALQARQALDVEQTRLLVTPQKRRAAGGGYDDERVDWLMTALLFLFPAVGGALFGCGPAVWPPCLPCRRAASAVCLCRQASPATAAARQPVLFPWTLVRPGCRCAAPPAAVPLSCAPSACPSTCVRPLLPPSPSLCPGPPPPPPLPGFSAGTTSAPPAARWCP
jgi:hypothetical protein